MNITVFWGYGVWDGLHAAFFLFKGPPVRRWGSAAWGAAGSASSSIKKANPYGGVRLLLMVVPMARTWTSPRTWSLPPCGDTRLRGICLAIDNLGSPVSPVRVCLSVLTVLAVSSGLVDS